MGGRGVIIQATMSSLFLLQLDCGSAWTGGLKVPASVAHGAEESSQSDPKQALFAPMPASGPFPSTNPHFHTASRFMSFFLSLPSASPFCLFLSSAPTPSHPLPPSPFLIPLILLLPSPPLSKPLFQDNRADGRLFVLYVPLENQLSC